MDLDLHQETDWEVSEDDASPTTNIAEKENHTGTDAVTAIRLNVGSTASLDIDHALQQRKSNMAWCDSYGIARFIRSNHHDIALVQQRFSQNVITDEEKRQNFERLSVIQDLAAIEHMSIGHQQYTAQRHIDELIDDSEIVKHIQGAVMKDYLLWNEKYVKLIMGNNEDVKYEKKLFKHCTKLIEAHFAEEDKKQEKKNEKSSVLDYGSKLSFKFNDVETDMESKCISYLYLCVLNQNELVKALRDCNLSILTVIYNDYVSKYSASLPIGGKLSEENIQKLTSKMGKKQIPKLFDDSFGIKHAKQWKKQTTNQANDQFIVFWTQYFKSVASDYVKEAPRLPEIPKGRKKSPFCLEIE